MTRNAWAVFLGLVLLSGAIAYAVNPGVNAGFADSKTVLAFATIVAVGIERLIELWWTLVSQAQRLGGWWPLSQIAGSVATLEEQTNKLLKPIFDDVKTGLETAKATLEKGSDELKVVDAELAKLSAARGNLDARLGAAMTLAPGSSRFALTTQVATDAAQMLADAAAAGGTASKKAAKLVDDAAGAAAIATTIVATFDDNPARRVASILLGASAGMLVAGFVGLNIFAAILEHGAGLAGGPIGVLLTGIVIGLGSNPTHEVIKSLQTYKESRKPSAAAALTAGQSVGSMNLERASGVRELNVRSADRMVRMARGSGLRSDSILIRSTD
jgi:hypothetical protein